MRRYPEPRKKLNDLVCGWPEELAQMCHFIDDCKVRGVCARRAIDGVKLD